MQSTLTEFIKVIQKKQQEEERFKDLRWDLTPRNIFKLYKAQAIDRNYAIYILETLFYEDSEHPSWWTSTQEKNKRTEMIQYIVNISKKDNELLEFLESVLLTEWHYFVRLEALLHLSTHFNKKAKELFIFLSNQKQDNFLPYILKRCSTSKLLPLIKIIDKTIIKIYILIKSNLESFFYYNVDKEWITDSNYHSIFSIKNHERKLKRFKIITLFSNKEILNLPIKSFVWESGRLDYETKTIRRNWRFDKANTNPQIILYEESNQYGKEYFTIKEKFLKEFIESLKKEFLLKDIDFEYSLVKTMTSYYYLIIEIKKINLYVKYHLSHYEVMNSEERKECEE